MIFFRSKMYFKILTINVFGFDFQINNNTLFIQSVIWKISVIKLNQFCDQIQLKSNVWLTPLLCIKRKNDSSYTFVWQWIRWKYQNSERISTENSQIYLFDNNMVLLSKFLEWKAYIEKSHKNPSAFTIEPSICTITCKSGTWEKSSQKWKRNRISRTILVCIYLFEVASQTGFCGISCVSFLFFFRTCFYSAYVFFALHTEIKWII